MRKLFILILIMTAAVFAGLKSYADENQKRECQLIGESLKDISKIEIGMKRAELLKTFEEEGGISTRTQKRYVYKKCPLIKIEVKFSPVGNEANKSAESDDDKIIEVSKPYLENAIID